MSFDLSDFEQQDTADMTVYDPRSGDAMKDADGNVWTWTFSGPGHIRTIDQKNAMLRKAFRKQRQKGSDAEPDPVELERDGIEYIVGRLLTFGPIMLAGKRVEFSAAVATDLLSNPKFSWLKNAANQYLNDETSFMPRSKKN